MSDDPKLDRALADILPHLRDVSLRDGIQSWDGNRWRIDDILPVAQEINTLAVMAKDELGVKMAPAEVWGGGQVLQPALFLKEDPFQNLERLKEAMPDMELQSLYRGRQGYGFKPISEEVQREAIKESADRGIQVFRVFDMMNDPENVQTGIRALVDYKEAHPEKGVRIEGAVSYISEPEGPKGRAWTLEEYGDYAVKLAKMGADEIVIKNYAGVGDKEMPDLVKTIHAKLEEASKEPGMGHLADMKVNLHSHGQKPELFATVLAAGADKVDVAIGELSGGPAHTNMRDLITLMLEEKGFTRDAIDAHPVMQQLSKIEDRIHEVVHREQEFTVNGKTVTDTFDNRRGRLKSLDPDDIERYRVAQGALSDLAARAQGQREGMFEEVLQKSSELWERAGRFNTVTPGAKIIIDQAVKLKLRPKANMTDYDDDFIKVIIGRFGRNQGMDKGVGDVQWRDALLMFKALNVLNKGAADREIDPLKYQMIISTTGFGEPGRRLFMRNGGVDLTDPGLEGVLMQNSESTIARFSKVIEGTQMPEELKAAVLSELKPGRSPTPREGLAEGRAIIDGLHKRDDVEVPAYAPMLAMLLRETGGAGDPDKIIKGLYAAPPVQGHVASVRNASPEAGGVAVRA